MPEHADPTPGLSRPDLVRVLESAALLQAVVPDATLVGGSAAALWASHRTSFDGQQLRVPTPEETLRIKGYLIVRRNQVRDYLDVAALADRYGIPHSAQVLARIDEYYTDQRGPEAEGVATQLARQLANPQPADRRTIRQLNSYKGLEARWAVWENVTGVCRSLATEMTR